MANQITLTEFDSLPNEARLRPAQVAQLEGISRSTLWRWCRSKTFPKPSKVGGITSWSVGDIRRFYVDRAIDTEAR